MAFLTRFQQGSMLSNRTLIENRLITQTHELVLWVCINTFTIIILILSLVFVQVLTFNRYEPKICQK